MAPRIKTDRYSTSGVELTAKGSAHAIAKAFSRIRTQDESLAIFWRTTTSSSYWVSMADIYAISGNPVKKSRWFAYAR